MFIPADTSIAILSIGVQKGATDPLVLRILSARDQTGEVSSPRGVAYRLGLTIPVREGKLSWSWKDAILDFTKRRLATGKWVHIGRMPGPDHSWFETVVLPALADWFGSHEAEMAGLFEECARHELRTARDQVRSYDYIVTHYGRLDRVEILAEKRALVAAYEEYLALLSGHDATAPAASPAEAA